MASEHIDSYDEDVPGPVASPPARRPGRPQRWMFLLAVGVAVIPLAYAEFPREVARWHVAAALEKYQSGDLIGTLKSMQEARSWDENSEMVFEKQALREYDLKIQANPDVSQLYLQRSAVLHLLGRYEEAATDCSRAVDLVTAEYVQQMSGSLNGLAYARALNKKDLDEGLREVEQAMRLAGDRADMLDTRGYLHFLKGDFELARKDLDLAVEKTEQSLKELTPAPGKKGARIANLAARRAQLRSSLAVMCYHRSQLLDAMKLTTQAEADRKRIREMGVEPSDKLH